MNGVTSKQTCRLLILSDLCDFTGNRTTAFRIRHHLTSDFEVVLHEARGTSESRVQRLIKENDVDIIIAIHAFKSGRVLGNVNKPFVLILGGTDLNVDASDSSRQQTVCGALKKASKIVAFNDDMSSKAASICPGAKQRICIIRPAVSLDIDSLEQSRSFSDSLGIHQSSKPYQFFLLPSSLRSVKDPLFLLSTFSRWHVAAGQNYVPYLVVIGPALEDDLADQVISACKKMPGIHYHQPVPQNVLFAIMKQCFAVVNCSLSEGLSNVVLEAMHLHLPVLGRSHASNKVLLGEGRGLLFDTPEEFVELAKRLSESPSLRQNMVAAAASYVSMHHGLEGECRKYRQLVHDVL